MKIAVLKLRGKTIPFVILKVNAIITKLTGNLNFTTPNPTLLFLKSQADALNLAYQAALKGGTDKKEIMHTRYDELMQSMSLLQAYVQQASGGDGDKILSAGFDTKNAPAPVGLLPAPQNVRAAYSETPGEVILRWTGVPKKKDYKVQYTNDILSGSSWKDPEENITGKKRFVFTGLTSGTRYWFRVFTVSSAGLSGPSDPATLMAP